MDTKKVLITGASGFIGSHLSKKLEDEGNELILIDNFSRGRQEYLSELGVKSRCLNIDLRNYDDIKEHFSEVDVVYHLAAKIGGMQYLHGSAQREISTFHENLLIDRNVFKSCLEGKVKSIVYTSSVSVYNTKVQTILNNIYFDEDSIETMDIDPEGGYGWVKFIGEKQLDIIKDCGINVGIARLFKCYGPQDDLSEESSNVIISLCKKAVKYPKEPFVVWGNGDATRDFFYIDDCIDGLIKIGKYIDNNKKITVNLGFGKPVSIKNVAEKISNISKKGIDIEYDFSKSSGPLSRTAEISKANKYLGWVPLVKLDYGLKKTYEWVVENDK